MDERQIHHVVVFESGTQLSVKLKADLQRYGDFPRFAVTSGTCPHALDAGKCDVIIIRIDGRSSEAVSLPAECHRLHPCLPVLVLVDRGDTSAAVAAMKAGAADCLEEPWETNRLLSALRAVLNEGKLPRRQLCGVLTAAQIRVFHLILAGRTNREIARQLHRSRRTVETHRRNLMRKLGVSGLVDLARYAVRAGLFAPDAGNR